MPHVRLARRSRAHAHVTPVVARSASAPHPRTRPRTRARRRRIDPRLARRFSPRPRPRPRTTPPRAFARVATSRTTRGVHRISAVRDEDPPEGVARAVLRQPMPPHPATNHHPIIQSRHRSKSFHASPRATLGRRRPSTLEISHRERHRFDVAPRTARRAPRVERAAVTDAVCPTSYVRTHAPATRPRAPFRERFRARPRSRAIGVPTAPEGVTARGRDRSIARFPAKTAPTTADADDADDADRRPKSDVDDLPSDRSTRDRRRRDATRRRRRRRARRRRFFFQ